MKTIFSIISLVVLSGSCHAAGNVNLALGKKYEFSAPPNYALCRDAADSTQLTDGKWQQDGHGQFWTSKSTVGWSVGSTGVRTVTLDLGQDEPLKGFSWNYAAGRAGVLWPDFIYVYTSVDKKKWYFVGDLLAASAAENGPPNKDGYAVVRAFSSSMPCHGRYVTFLVQGHGFIFVDELEAWQGPKANLSDAVDAEVVLSPIAHYSAVRESLMLAQDAKQILSAVSKLDKTSRLRAEKSLHHLNAIVAQSRGYTKEFFWQCDRWANNSPIALPKSDDVIARPLTVEMMRLETRSCAVNLTNPTDKDISVTVKARGIPKSANLELREVVPTIVKSGARVAGLLLPNEAAPALSVTIPAGETKELWISFAKPELAEGTYTGELVAAGAKIPLSLRISHLTFPERPRLHVGGWDYSACSNVFYRAPGNLPAKMARMREMFTDTPWSTAGVMPKGAKFNAEGALVNAGALDFSEWRQLVGLWGDQARQYCVFMSVSREFHGEKMGTERFKRMVGEYMRAWYDGVKDSLNGRRIIILLVDEPREKEMDERVITWARAVKASAPEFVIFEDIDYKDPTKATPELFEVSEIICPPCPLMTAAKTEDFFAKLGRRGKELWLYSCCGPARQFDPITYYRAQAWHAWKIGAKGTFFWAFGCGGGIGDSFKPFNQPGVEYSPFFVSPTNAFRAKQSEAILESVEDYEYLAMLRDKIERGKKAKMEVGSLEKLLEGAPARALGEEAWLKNNEYSFAEGARRYDWNQAHNHTAIDAVRLEILRALEAPLKK